MGAEKGGTKSSGFFHLFDWNRKSRKKLFSNGTVSPENFKQEKRSDDNLPTTRLRLIDEDEIAGVSSVKGSSDYSCASSVTDEEGNAIRAPGVVARLMGLDSMPTSGVSEPSCTPFFDTQSLRDKQNHKRSPEFYINDEFNHTAHKADSYYRKPMELRSQKMPSSPIERFQTETIPPRTAKPVPFTNRKLLSPIKNPGFITAENAAHIMEAAAKILDSGHQAATGTKVSTFAPSSIPLKIRGPRESLANPQRTSRYLESSKTPIDSTDLRYFGGQPLNRSWNGSEDTAVLRRSPDPSGTNLADAKGKGKSISLAVQAKVNVQRREGLSTSGRSTFIRKDHDECKLDQPFKSQPNNQKSKQLKKGPASSASGVLRQNNQKQNCISNRGKLSSKQLTSNQHGRKVLSGDGSSTKNKTVNKFSGNSRVGPRKEALETTDSGSEGASSINKDFPQKKRLIEGAFQSERNGFVDNLVDRRQKRAQPNVLIDEHTRCSEDNKSDGADVVSFTFTSPLIKPVTGSQSTAGVEKWDKRNMYCFDTHNQKVSGVNNKKLSSHGLNVITGDALSLLLEQKLRELTLGVDPSHCNFGKAGSFAGPSPVSQESTSAFDSLRSVPGEEHDKQFVSRECKDLSGGVFSGVSSTNGQVFGLSNKLQKVEEVKCSSSSDAQNEPDQQHRSPLSIFDASFSNESFISAESSGSTDGSKACCSSSIKAQNVVSMIPVNKPASLETEMELSDSASSTFTETSAVSDLCSISRTKASGDQDLDYVREILCSSASTSEDLSLCSLAHARRAIDPLLFYKLEGKRRGKVQDGRMRKALFDCVNECLDSKCSRYFQAGYRAWAKGVASVGKEGLSKEVYKEISGWKRMGDWMVDELVDKDMSSHLGRWVDFEIEAFESGIEIENEIVSSLVDEVIADCLIKGPCL